MNYGIRRVGCLLVGVFLTISFSVCSSGEKAKLVNSQTIAIGSVSTIALDYDADDLVIKNSKSQKIVLEEYFSRDKRKYYSKISKRGDAITIKEGKRPIGTGFRSKMVLSLPKEYAGGLQVHSTSGRIKTEISNKSISALSLDTTSGKIAGDDLKAEMISLTTTSGLISSNSLSSNGRIQIKSTSGPIDIQNVRAKKITLQTTSSKSVLKKVTGQVTYESKSGRLSLSTFSGSGNFLASGDGPIKLTLKKLTDDLSAFSKNGAITVTLPPSQKAHVALKSREGKIRNQWKKSENAVKASVPQLKLETRNGDITVK